MSNINAFIKIIISITFLWSIGECLLPDSSIQKYTGFIYGLIIISLVVSVFTGVKDADFSFAYNDIKNTSDYNSNYVKSVYEDNLEKILRDKFNDKSIKVELTDDYKINRITCADSETYEAIMRYINE